MLYAWSITNFNGVIKAIELFSNNSSNICIYSNTITAKLSTVNFIKLTFLFVILFIVRAGNPEVRNSNLVGIPYIFFFCTYIKIHKNQYVITLPLLLNSQF